MSEVIAPMETNERSEENFEPKHFKIAEVSDLLGVKPHVLRYWESEFPQIRPVKSKSGQRLYRRRDFEALKQVQRLLYQERCTIASARQALRQFFENDALETELKAPAMIENEQEFDAGCVNLKTQENELSARATGSVLSKTDVFDIVEEKMTKSELREKLCVTRTQLKEIISLLAA